MLSENEKEAVFAAEIILHLARLAHGEGHACGLTSAQWAALRYFARANRSSRTLMAFADYHVATPGTASQIVKNLVTKGLLTRSTSESDRRSARIDLTAEGLALYENDPFNELARVIANMPPAIKKDLLSALEHVKERIVAERRSHGFGTCSACRYLKICANQGEEGEGHICKLTGLPLGREEIDLLCMHYKPDIS